LTLRRHANEILAQKCVGAPSLRVKARIVGTDAQGVAFDSDSIPRLSTKGNAVNSIVYIVGAIVIIVAILSFVGLR